MAHQLLITVDDSVNDNRFLYVADLSIYDEVLGAKKRLLQILPPFSDEYLVLPFPKLQKTAYTTDHLQLTCNGAQDIPDGPYKFNFSCAPNSQINITVSHFRVAGLMNMILAKMAQIAITCDVSLDSCGNVNQNKFQNMLLHIWMLLKAAQNVGMNDLTTPKAQELYDQAQSAYNQLYKIDDCKMC